MDFDPLTEAFPTRTTQDEEEAEAEPHSDLLSQEPAITVGGIFVLCDKTVVGC